MQPKVYKKQLVVGRMLPSYVIKLHYERGDVMKFCDKLQKIRKENNITQEGLADKLSVSRQAVSKWESGTAYPDTEKLIQISKIFNVSLDELVNDNKDSSSIKKNKKFNFMETFDIISKFISKSFNMFWSMKFWEKCKCFFEMAILVLVIYLIAYVSNMIIVEIIRRIFMFLSGNIVSVICQLVDTLLYIAWIILGLVIVIRIFKTRYLDYYVVIDDDSVKERVKEEPIKELKEKKEYKVVIRDPEHSSYNFMKKIWEILLFIFKCFCIFIAFPIIIAFIFMVGLFVISLSYLFSGIFFDGITLAILGGILFAYIIIEFMYNVIFDRSNAYGRIFLLFIISISLVGVGIGLSFASLNSFTINENDLKKIDSHIINWDDKLVIQEIKDIPKDNIIIDNNLDYIKLDIKTNDIGKVNIYSNNIYDKNNVDYKVIHIYYDYNNINVLKNIINDLKNKKINKYDNDYEIDKIYISESNLTKLRENYLKYND